LPTFWTILPDLLLWRWLQPTTSDPGAIRRLRKERRTQGKTELRKTPSGEHTVEARVCLAVSQRSAKGRRRPATRSEQIGAHLRSANCAYKTRREPQIVTENFASGFSPRDAKGRIERQKIVESSAKSPKRISASTGVCVVFVR